MRKKILRIVCLFLLTVVAAAAFCGCAGNAGEETDFYARVRGRVFEGDDFIGCGIVIENKADGEKRFEITDCFGRFDISLGKGEYKLTFVKDSQYLPATYEVIVEKDSELSLPDIRLEKSFDLASLGYHTAELHQHSTYSDGKNEPSDMYLYNHVSAVGFAALSDHNSVSGNGEFVASGEVLGSTVTIGGVEISSSDKGHINALGTTTAYNSVFGSADDVKAVVAQAKADGAYVQINHPARGGGKGFAYIDRLPEFGFDGYELWNGRNAPSPLSGTNLAAKQIWFDYLDKGFYIPATAGADNHGFAEQNVDMPRTYVYTSDTSASGYIDAIKAGHSFLSNGPVIDARISGVSYGDSVAPGEKRLEIKAFGNAVIGKIDVLVNGISALSFDADGMRFDRSETLTLEAGDYVVMEITSPGGGYAITNPIFCA